MKVIQEERQADKVSLLIMEADGREGEIVCQSLIMSMAILEQANKMGCKIRNPITYDDLLMRGRGGDLKDYYFHDFHSYFKQRMSINIKAFTVGEEL